MAGERAADCASQIALGGEIIIFDYLAGSKQSVAVAAAVISYLDVRVSCQIGLCDPIVVGQIQVQLNLYSYLYSYTNNNDNISTATCLFCAKAPTAQV